MARKTHALTDLKLRAWIAEGAPVAKADGNGLTFTLSKAGTASWVLRYSIAGRRREVTLGNYPDVSIKEARIRASDLRARIDKGEDPAAEKRTAKARELAAMTVRELAAEFLATQLPGKSDSTVYYRTADIENVIVPRLGTLQASKVTPSDVVAMLKGANRTWTVTKRILTTTRQLFDMAFGQTVVSENPCNNIRMSALMGKRPPVKKRVMLTEEELRKLLPAIDEEIGIENALALRILLATCVRSIELTKARWEHIDTETMSWWVPYEVVKTRQGFRVPITPTVMDWFERLRALAGDSPWVLPARQERRNRSAGEETHVGTTTLWAAISRLFERKGIDIQRFTPHDTRSTAKGHMRNMGISREISEIALNHKLQGMEGVYDVREEIPERREAMELWADFLVACETGKPSPKRKVTLRLVA